MRITITHVLIFFTLSIYGAQLRAQPSGEPITFGEQMTIESAVLGEQRSVIVGLPESYQSNDASYPVLYILDGSVFFNYTNGVVQLLAANEFIPEMIVIAVNNTDRARDLTPPSQEPNDLQIFPKTGGADNFQRFFAEELMPWVEKHFRTQPYKVLIGHSFGGLFAIHTLTTRPDLFNAYIAISPSMQWNAQGLVAQAEQFFTATEQLPVSLYMTAGDEGGELLGGTRKLAGELDAAAPEDFLWQFDHLPQETHGSVPLRSTYQGLEFVFANWFLRNPYEFYSRYGMEAVQQFYAFGDKRYGVDRGIPFMTISYLLGSMVRSGDLDAAVAMMNRESVRRNALAGQLGYLANMLRDSGDQADATQFYRLALQKNPGDMIARGALDEWGVDYSDLVSEQRVDPDTLQRYEGVYSSSRTADITVQVEQGRLYRELNATRFELHPLDDAQFYLQEDDVRYNFKLSSSGEVSGIRIRQGNTWIFAERR